MNLKKSQGLPINVIILAAIALVALIVILAIFTNFSSKTAKNIGSCVTKDGKCAYDIGGECKDKYPIPLIVSGDCEKKEPKNVCCLKAE